MNSESILTVRAVRKLYPVSRGLLGALRRRPKRFVHALDGVSFTLRRGEILGLVGESGSRTTTVAMNIMGQIDPTEGEIRFEDSSVPEMVRGRDRLKLRRGVQMDFQDPYEVLNPRQTVFQILAEPLEIHGLATTKPEKARFVSEALADAGLKPPEAFLDRHPEDLSGGQRQRVIVTSLILNPRLLVADEPVSMLDVSIRAEILNLLRELRNRHGITILYITHDLVTAGFFTDRIAVMYLGRIVEIGPTAEVLTRPKHPYARALLSVVPVPNPRRRRKRLILQGEIPSPIDLPSGCCFHLRCPDRIERCHEIDPELYAVGAQHYAACILVEGANHDT